MKKTFILLGCLFLAGCAMAEGSNKSLFALYGFKESVFRHVETLGSIGPRTAGSDGEKQAARYIRAQFEKNGLATRTETFDFTIFEIRKTRFTLAGTEFPVEQLGFDPYGQALKQKGNAFLFNPEDDADPDVVKDKTVVTCRPTNFFMLMALGAKTVVYLNPKDFKESKNLDSKAFILEIEGEFKKLRSANIVGELPAAKETEKEILITAHYDAYGNSPGANDNATGIGAIIELARIFLKERNSLTANLKFIALGGEETGLLGSRMYLNAHQCRLEKSLLAINLDTIGGQGKICVESLGGVSKEVSGRTTGLIPEYLMDKGWEGANGGWRIMNQEIFSALMIANVPDWLKQIIESAGRSQNIEIQQSGGLFSDLRTFAQAGIPATGVAQKTGSAILHSARDTAEKINLDQIEAAGLICYSVVLKTMAFYADL